MTANLCTVSRVVTNSRIGLNRLDAQDLELCTFKDCDAQAVCYIDINVQTRIHNNENRAFQGTVSRLATASALA